MALLLDSHAFLWLVLGDDRMSLTSRDVLRSSREPVWLSVVSAWEITIKTAKGRLDVDVPVGDLFTGVLEQFSIQLLDIRVPHLTELKLLTVSAHKDPFDRLIAAQSLSEGWPVVSADPAFDACGVTRIW
jgi:PIN domain nuclease of toxin-antitoxin system